MEIMTLTMADKILISILCLSGYAVSQSVNLTGNCSVTLPPEPFYVTGVNRPPLSCELLGTDSCSNGDLPASVGGPFMGAPASMSLDFILYPWDGVLYPKVEVTWEPPKSAAGISELKGFYIVFHKLTGPGNWQSICKVFDLSQNNFSAGDHKLKFTKTFVQFSGGPKYLYMVELYTLPYSPESEKLTEFFTLQATQSENNTGDWRAAMSYTLQNLSAPAQIDIKFSMAPSHFNFKKYNLYLIDSRDKNNYLFKCVVSVEEDYECQGQMYQPPGLNQRTFTHKFHDIAAGTYSLWVQPYDPYWQDDNRCLCYQEQSDSKTCVRCTTTMLNESIVVEGALQPPPSSTPPTTSPLTSTSTKGSETDDFTPGVSEVKQPQEDDSTTLVVAAVLGSVVGIALVFLVGFCLWKQRTRGVDITLPFFKQSTNNKMNTQVELPKKKICVVYAHDHQEHNTVVDKLARYLNDQCACQVFFMPWFQGETRTLGCYEWILRHIDKSDYVLIINSEAAFKLYEARNNNTSFRMEDKGPEEDMFLVAMSHVMAKQNQSDFYKRNILTYFEYTTEDFLLKDFGPGIQYKLTKHLKELLCHIHEVETHGLDPRMFTIDRFADVQSKPEGGALMEAITKAKTFQKRNPFWFTKNFQRQDSAYDSSSSPELDQDPGSVSITGPRFEYPAMNDDESRSTITCNTNYLKQDPEAMSAVTYNTQYQNNQPDFFPLAPSTVVTTTAPTEIIDDQLARINHLGINNPAFNGNSHFGESSSNDFIPPSEVVDDDIDEQLMNINRESFAPYHNMDPAYQHMDPAYQHMDPAYQHMDPAYQYMDPAYQHMDPAYQHLDPAYQHIDPSSAKFIPTINENQAGLENFPSRMYEDIDSSDGRDV